MFPVTLLLLVAFSVVGRTNSQSQVAPVNSAGRIGQRLELNCTFDAASGILWDRYPIGSPNSIRIYERLNDDPPVIQSGFEAGSRPDNIIISNLQYNTAGRYHCSTLGAGSLARTIQVAGAGAVTCRKEPDGEQNEGETPELICGAEISANDDDLKPRFQWFRDGQEVNSYLKVSETTPTPDAPEYIQYAHNITVSHNDHQVPFVCKVSFVYNGESRDSVDDSDPVYSESCELSFDVRFGARETLIQPSSHDSPMEVLVVNPGDMFNCSARGNPDVTYMFRDFQNNHLVQGNILLVTEDMVDSQTRTYNCTATNVINGQDYDDDDFVTFFAESRNGSGLNMHSSTALWIITAVSIITWAFH